MLITLLMILGVQAQSLSYNDMALIKAAARGDVKEGQALLKAGADPNAHESSSSACFESALYLASYGNFPEFVKLLLAQPTIDPNFALYEKCTHGATPLMAWIDIQSRQGGGGNILELYLNHPKTDLCKKNADGKTALKVARKLKQKSIADSIQAEMEKRKLKCH